MPQAQGVHVATSLGLEIGLLSTIFVQENKATWHDRFNLIEYTVTRYLWPFIIVLICLPVALLATGVQLPWLSDSPAKLRPLPVAQGDQELAWIHTTTNSATWERFVSGLMRVPQIVPGLQVDDSNAFQDSTTAVPEIIISREGFSGKLCIRWYKLHSGVTTADWIQALSKRNPAPLAFIGGGSTDRAVEMAKALQEQKSWQGDRPLLLITTATADKVATAEDAPGALPTRRLVDIYDERTFRFCFTNKQMADAVTDFVSESPEFRLGQVTKARLAVASGMAAVIPEGMMEKFRPQIFSVVWTDDPYSTDLNHQFTDSIKQISREEWRVDFQAHVPFSVGGFLQANMYEARTAEAIAQQLRDNPTQRMILVLPAVVQPARRMLRAISAVAPQAAHRMIVVTGDGVSVNTIYRDLEFAWPTTATKFPLVLFTHNNPFGWDTAKDTPPPGYALTPPNSTDEALHFRDMGAIIAESAFLSDGLLLNRADDLAKRLQDRKPTFFNDNGERRGGTGEYVVVLMPKDERDAGEVVGTLSAWRREPDRKWTLVHSVPVSVRKPTAYPSGKE